ncbi:hypothetical protein [Comamonas sp. JC664]|uniref:hypothetical protein n=1 Tax=Comamonas sp. JC664 TaxID=2801917 RepID=UPI003615FAB1
MASADGASPEAKDDKADKADNADSQAVAAEAGASAGKASSGQPAWSVRVDALKLSRLKGVWVDESVPLPARVQLDDFSMEAQQIAWPFKQPFSFEVRRGSRVRRACRLPAAWCSRARRPTRWPRWM